MALTIKNARAEALARALASATGESLTEAVAKALEERLARETGRRTADVERESIEAVLRHAASLPRLDARSPRDVEASLYDDDGLPR